MFVKVYRWLDRHPLLMLYTCMAIIFFISNGQEIISNPPMSIHQWRQSDCIAYGMTYYQKGTVLFTPSTFNLTGLDGRVVSEFPGIYYLGAKICHITGFHFWVFRALTYLCYLAGLVFLYKIARMWIKDAFLALFPVIIIATSPFYYYYALNFLPNVPAIGLSFVGLYYMIAYERSRKTIDIVVSTMLFILATALKPTDGGLTWLACVGAMTINTLLRKKWAGQRKVLTGIFVASLLIAACVYGWYKFAIWYNDKNQNHQNLLGIFSIAGLSSSQIRVIIVDRVFGFWFGGFHNKIIMWTAALMLLIYIVKWRALDHFLRLFTLFCILGTFVYSLLWFQAFTDHDYYQLIFVIAPTFLCITILEYYERRLVPKAGRGLRVSLGLALLALMVVGVVENKNFQDKRYGPDYRWFNMHMYEMGPVLEKWGIKKDDKVICVPDASPNITLAALGHQGFTECFFSVVKVDELRPLIKYLVIVDSSYLHNPLYEPYTTKLVGTYYGINVFDLR